jgi:purine nucleoside phosphorylase
VLCHFAKRASGVAAGDEKTPWKSRSGGHSGENGGNTLHAPIVSDQQQHAIRVAKIAAAASFRAACQTLGARKLAGVNAMGNYADVPP